MLAAQLDDIFAEIGLDRHHAVLFQKIVEADLLGDHGLALGDRPGAAPFGDVEKDAPGMIGILGEMDRAAGCLHLLDIGLDIEVEMLQRVGLDGDRIVAQGVEFRQLVDGLLTLADEALLHIAEGALEIDVGERLDGVRLECLGGDLHSALSVKKLVALSVDGSPYKALASSHVFARHAAIPLLDRAHGKGASARIGRRRTNPPNVMKRGAGDGGYRSPRALPVSHRAA